MIRLPSKLEKYVVIISKQSAVNGFSPSRHILPHIKSGRGNGGDSRVTH